MLWPRLAATAMPSVQPFLRTFAFLAINVLQLVIFKIFYLHVMNTVHFVTHPAMQRHAFLSQHKVALRPLNHCRFVKRQTLLSKASNGKEPVEKVDPILVEETVQELRKANVNKETAKEILKLWQSNGIADDPEKLRQLYKSSSVSVLGRFAIQLIFDVGAAGGVRKYFMLVCK